MKKYIVLLLFSLLLISNISFGQSGWFWQNPLPQGNSLFDVFSIGSNVYSVGALGTIIKSSNFGSNWQGISFSSWEKLNSTYFINSNTGHCCGTGGLLLKSTDSGLNWNTLNSNTSASLNSICFASDNVGFACGAGGTIIKTTDGGNTWTTLTSGTTYRLNCIKFYNLNTGIAAGGYDAPYGYTVGFIIKTTNAGLNWNYYETNSQEVLSLFISDSLLMHGVCKRGGYLKSFDGGTTWDFQIVGSTSSDITSVVYISSAIGYLISVYSSTSSIYKTTDSGYTWALSNTFSIAANKLAGDGTHLYMVGTGGVLGVSGNSGNNWTLNNTTNKNVYDFQFVDLSTGYAVGGWGSGSTNPLHYLLKTTNSGLNWDTLIINLNDVLKAVYFFNSNTGMVLSDGGSLLRTTNGGNSWTLTSTFSNMDYPSKFFFIDSLNGYIGEALTGFTGGIYKTTNSGLNWTHSGVHGVYSIYFKDINTGWYGSFNDLYKTINNGVTWTLQYSFTHGPFVSFSFPNGNTGYLLSQDGRVSKTTDSGENWFALPVDVSNGRNNQVIFVNSETGYIINSYGNIYKSTDGGYVWGLLRSNNSNSLNAMYFFNENIGYTAGDFGTILKTTDGGGIITSFNHTETYLQNEFQLLQNYPNPFNPVTKIKFDISKLSLAKIIIYDILGREVTTLLNEELKPGTYSVDWDGSNYASGIYFYRLEAEDFTETKKMVLVK